VTIEAFGKAALDGDLATVKQALARTGAANQGHTALADLLAKAR